LLPRTRNAVWISLWDRSQTLAAPSGAGTRQHVRGSGAGVRRSSSGRRRRRAERLDAPGEHRSDPAGGPGAAEAVPGSDRALRSAGDGVRRSGGRIRLRRGYRTVAIAPGTSDAGGKTEPGRRFQPGAGRAAHGEVPDMKDPKAEDRKPELNAALRRLSA